MHSRFPILGVVATAVAATTAPAQSTIRGTVTTAAHAPLANASVQIAVPPRSAVTGANGGYVLRDLPGGHYEVVVTALGYRPLRRSVDVSRGATVTVDVELEPGSLLLSSVVTTATRTAEEASRVASTVNVLTAGQIRTTPARETQDLLREIPSVELPRTSSLVGGSAQIVSIRGVDEGRTAVLFDGIPVNDAWGEWIDWGRVPKNMLDRVEVVEGGTSSLYGNGAMGGVISFYSRPLSPGAANLVVEGGSRDTRHVFASAGVPLVGALTAVVSGDYQSGGGYTLIGPGATQVVANGVASSVASTPPGVVDVPSQIIQRNATVRLNYAPSATLSAFVAGHKYGDNRLTGTALAYTTRDQGDLSMGLDWGRAAAPRGLLTVRAWNGRQDEHQRSTGVRSNSTTCSVPSSAPRQCEDSSVVADIPSHDWGGSAMWTRSGVLSLQSFSVGGDYRHYAGDFDEVDFNTSCPGASCGKVTRTILSGGDQALSGAFVQAVKDVIPAKAGTESLLRIEMSARLDGWSNTDGRSVDAQAGTVAYENRHKSAFSPRLGARWQIHPTLSLHGAAYRAFRAPNLAELYRKQISATSITLPNPDLAPETALGREVGLDWQPAQWVQLKGTFYVADYHDFNVPTTLSTTNGVTTRQRLNVNSSRSRGVESYLALRPIPSIFLSAAVNYDDARQQSGITDPDHKPHINRVPSPKQTLRAEYASRTFGTWTGIWRHEGHTTTLQGLWLEPYSVFDAHVHREIVPGVTGFVAVENVGDTKYQINLSGTGSAALVSYGMPRTVRLGVSLDRN
jgi:outer membrane receptor protein involved in Fe transport